MVQEIIVWVLIVAALGWSIQNICRKFKIQSACGCGCSRCERTSLCCGPLAGTDEVRGSGDKQKAPDFPADCQISSRSSTGSNSVLKK